MRHSRCPTKRLMVSEEANSSFVCSGTCCFAEVRVVKFGWTVRKVRGQGFWALLLQLSGDNVLFFGKSKGFTYVTNAKFNKTWILTQTLNQRIFTLHSISFNDSYPQVSFFGRTGYSVGCCPSFSPFSCWTLVVISGRVYWRFWTSIDNMQSDNTTFYQHLLS